VYGVFLFVLLPTDNFGSKFGLVVAAACCGFLVWNWEPAKLFMGDVGSGPLGLLFVIGGALALANARSVVVFLPLFPLFLDALLTLILRFRRGERVTDAHRAHLYQRVVSSGVRHSVVSSVYALAAAIGAFVAVAVNRAQVGWTAFAISAYVLAVTLAWKWADERFVVNKGRTRVMHGTPH
jgi:Fuc2NAc and GlcNAc transferase